MSNDDFKCGRGPLQHKSAGPLKDDFRHFASVKEFAQLLGISEATVWRRLADGKIVSMKFGGTRRIDVPASLTRLSGGTGER